MDITNAIEAGAAIVTVLGGIGVFTFQAGQFKRSVELNTTATEKLTEVLDNHIAATSQTLHEHDIRLTKLEAQK